MGDSMKTNAAQTIDEYISAFPPNVQTTLEQIRQTIHQAAPEATEAIKYQMPTFVLHGNLVHFAAFQQHIGFYPAPTGIAAFKEALANYEQAKGTIRFPLNAPVPLELIAEIVKFRVAENARRAASKTKRR